MGQCQQKKVWRFVNAMSMPAPTNQTLPLVQPGVQSDYFIKTKFLGEISIEKCVAFCPRLPGADKILLARALHNIPLEMSIEESLVQFRLPSTLIPFVFITSFQIVRNSARSLGLV